MSSVLDKLMSLDMKEELAIFDEMEAEYKKFRARIGEIAVAHGRNPFNELIAFLDASLRTEKMRVKEVEKTRNEKVDRVKKILEDTDIDVLVSDALGCRLEEAKDMDLTPENVEAVIRHLDKLANEGDEELDI